jgi:glycosyltransferase involved in cell wall biosynthesis
MKDGTPPFLIDVSRLLRRLQRGRLPTGIDRVALAYVSRYGHCSRAFIRYGRFHAVLPENNSRLLFQQLLNPPSDFTLQALKFVVSGVTAGVRRRDLAGSILFNVGHSGLEDRHYSDLLRRMDVRPVFLVHDLIPITHPEFCRAGEREKHLKRMRTVLELAQGVITNSQATLDSLALFAESEQRVLPPATTAFLASPDMPAAPGRRPADRPYFVVLGTIEPRKNHLLLLQVWRRLVERMGKQAPLLVIVGQIGWECENILDLLERCEQLRGHVLQLPACSDTDLANWLRHARALLFPSFVEGFGLPLVESLELGTPVIASDLTVFHEIAGDIPEYLDPLDGMGWMSMIIEYSARESRVRNRQLQRMSRFVAPTWEKHFKQVDELLQRVGG